ncbi:restriction endonuclease subunit S [Acetobacter malorum]|nr:restriction endonuclease subunit S [Acetobacter malorum]
MRASHWSEKRAEDFCLSVRDGTHDSPKPTAYGKKLITSKNIIGSHISLENSYRISIEDAEKVDKRSLVEQWDVLISMIGTVGEVCLIKEKPDFSIKNIGLFKSKGKEEGVYLYYYLKSQLAKNYIENRLAGSTQKYISLTELRNIPIKYPKNREEMCAINYVLSYLDDKIDLNRRTNETLEAMARALFRDWFVDFGPTRAKMAGEAPYLAPELWELFPDRLDDEGNPEGWKIGELQELTVNICNGGTPKRTESSYWENGDIPWLTSGEIRKQYISETENHITNEGLENSSAKWIPAGSIVIALYGATAGEVGLTAAKMTTNQAISSLMPKSICKAYIFLHMLHSKINLANKATGSAQQNLSKNLIETFETLIPSDKILYEFENKTSLLFDRIIKNFDESHTLAQLRDLLLPKLMSGEISIRDAEKMVEDAT